MYVKEHGCVETKLYLPKNLTGPDLACEPLFANLSVKHATHLHPKDLKLFTMVTLH